jgi:hypothetical protein
MKEVAIHEGLGELLSQPGNHPPIWPAKLYLRYLVGPTEPTTGAFGTQESVSCEHWHGGICFGGVQSSHSFGQGESDAPDLWP